MSDERDELDRIHGPEVDRLAAAADWAGLCRYWLAHRYTPALDKAIEVTGRLGGPRGVELTRFLEAVRQEPLDPECRPPDIEPKSNTSAEKATLTILLRYPFVTLCEFAQQFPVKHQAQALREGVEAARAVVKLAAAVEDAPLVASFLTTLAYGLSNSSDPAGAARACREAEGIYRALVEARPDAFRPLLAGTLNNLGAALSDLGDPTGAVTAYREAEAVCRALVEVRPGAFRPALAMTLNNLGNALRALGDSVGALKASREAEVLYRALALVEVRPGAFSPVPTITYGPALAITLNSLGTSLLDLGDPEGALKAYREAERICRFLARVRPVARVRPDALRPDLAMTLTNLGIALHDLGDPAGALTAYREAEGIRRELARGQPDAFRPDLANTLNSLGNALRDLGEPTGAVTAFREAEGIRRELARVWPDAFRPDLAMTLNNLGNALLDLGDPAGALKAYRETEVLYRALANVRSDAFRPDVAMSLNGLGNALRDLGDPAGAVTAYRQADELYDKVGSRLPTAFLPARIRTAANLGRLLLTQHASLNWPDRPAAREALRKACRLTERYRGSFKDRKQRRRVLQESMAAYRLLVEVCIDIGRINRDDTAWQEAAEVAEASRARALMELLAEQELTPANTPPGLVEEFRTLRKHLRDAILRLEMEDERQARGDQAAERLRPGPAEPPPADDSRSGVRSPQLLDSYYRTPTESRRAFLAAEVERLSADHVTLLERVRQHDSEFDPDRPVPPVSFSEMQALIPADRPTAVVQYTLTENRGVAFVITRDGVDAVELTGLGARRGMELANEWDAAYRRALESSDLMKEWAEKVFPCKLAPMAEAAVLPVVEKLGDVERLILVPDRSMYLFPLHAAVLPDRTYLADRFEVGYTPSLSVLARCRSRTRPTPTRLLLAVNPTGDLHFADPEADIVRLHFPAVAEMRRSDVIRHRLLGAASGQGVVHYSGHSYFQPDEPLRSGLVLKTHETSDEWLTLRDVFCGLHLQQSTLVVLSGCESGMVVPDQLDEYVGLPLGFLYAGATCVLGSLWAVDDPVTMLTMDKFYDAWQGGQAGVAVGAALAKAQEWLRAFPSGPAVRKFVLSAEFLDRLGADLDRTRCRVWAIRLAELYPDRPPFASPAFWAPFVASGLSYAVPARLAKSG